MAASLTRRARGQPRRIPAERLLPVLRVAVFARLAVGIWRPAITTARTRLQVHAVYQTLIFVLESVVFSLIGLQLPTLIRALRCTARWLLPALAVTATPDRAYKNSKLHETTPEPCAQVRILLGAFSEYVAPGAQG